MTRKPAPLDDEAEGVPPRAASLSDHISQNIETVVELRRQEWAGLKRVREPLCKSSAEGMPGGYDAGVLEPSPIGLTLSAQILVGERWDEDVGQDCVFVFGI